MKNTDTIVLHVQNGPEDQNGEGVTWMVLPLAAMLCF